MLHALSRERWCSASQAAALRRQRQTDSPFASPARTAATRYDARVIRDRFGVPHIYGKRNADVVFGLAYAHAER